MDITNNWKEESYLHIPKNSMKFGTSTWHLEKLGLFCLVVLISYVVSYSQTLMEKDSIENTVVINIST